MPQTTEDRDLYRVCASSLCKSPQAICNIRIWQLEALVLDAASILGVPAQGVCAGGVCHAQAWQQPHPAVSGDPVPKSHEWDQHCAKAVLPVGKAGANVGCGGDLWSSRLLSGLPSPANGPETLRCYARNRARVHKGVLAGWRLLRLFMLSRTAACGPVP